MESMERNDIFLFSDFLGRMCATGLIARVSFSHPMLCWPKTGMKEIEIVTLAD